MRRFADLSVFRSKYVLFTCAALFILVNFFNAFSTVSHSNFSSYQSVFAEFLNGSLRLIFPLLVTLLVTWRSVRDVAHRHIAHTRTRISLRRYLAHSFARPLVGIFVFFFAVGILAWLCAFVIVPALYPHTVNPRGYGLTSVDEVLAYDAKSSALGVFLYHGEFVFALVSATWLAANAVIFGSIGLLATFLLKRPILALCVPFIIYFVESTVVEVLSAPSLALIISAIYPCCLRNYPLIEAVIPTLALAVIAGVGVVYLFVTAPKNPRFS